MEMILGLGLGAIVGFYIAFLFVKLLQPDKWKGKGFWDMWHDTIEKAKKSNIKQ